MIPSQFDRDNVKTAGQRDRVFCKSICDYTKRLYGDHETCNLMCVIYTISLSTCNYYLRKISNDVVKLSKPSLPPCGSWLHPAACHACWHSHCPGTAELGSFNRSCEHASCSNYQRRKDGNLFIHFLKAKLFTSNIKCWWNIGVRST